MPCRLILSKRHFLYSFTFSGILLNFGLIFSVEKRSEPVNVRHQVQGKYFISQNLYNYLLMSIIKRFIWKVQGASLDLLLIVHYL
jgi:hypothetical protein